MLVLSEPEERLGQQQGMNRGIAVTVGSRQQKTGIPVLALAQQRYAIPGGRATEASGAFLGSNDSLKWTQAGCCQGRGIHRHLNSHLPGERIAVLQTKPRLDRYRGKKAHSAVAPIGRVALGKIALGKIPTPTGQQPWRAEQGSIVASGIGLPGLSSLGDTNTSRPDLGSSSNRSSYSRSGRLATRTESYPRASHRQSLGSGLGPERTNEESR